MSSSLSTEGAFYYNNKKTGFIYLYLTIAPKYLVSYIVQVLKRKSSAFIKKKTKRFPLGTLWNRGCFVSTVGLPEHAVSRAPRPSTPLVLAMFPRLTVKLPLHWVRNPRERKRRGTVRGSQTRFHHRRTARR